MQESLPKLYGSHASAATYYILRSVSGLYKWPGHQCIKTPKSRYLCASKQTEYRSLEGEPLSGSCVNGCMLNTEYINHENGPPETTLCGCKLVTFFGHIGSTAVLGNYASSDQTQLVYIVWKILASRTQLFPCSSTGHPSPSAKVLRRWQDRRRIVKSPSTQKMGRRCLHVTNINSERYIL